MDFFRRQRNSRFTERRETAENILRKTELKKSRTNTEKKYRRENRKKNRQTRERNARRKKCSNTLLLRENVENEISSEKERSYFERRRKTSGEKRDRARTHTRIGARFSRYYLRRTCNDCIRLHVRNRIIEGIPSAGIPSRRENKAIRRIRRSNDGVRNIAYATRKRIR